MATAKDEKLKFCRLTTSVRAYVGWSAPSGLPARSCPGLQATGARTVAASFGQVFPTYRVTHTYSDFWQAYQGVFGENHQSVGKETGQTAHVERWNNTLRQRLARFVRKSLAFSKSDEFHRIALQVFIHEYNLTRFS
ncbi:IS1 family transposase [Methylovulum sp.]|uniref:IS1 family transposase n=1 Tax=Methylovulum sp. TaxID=1916980 RepID=UPI00263452EB|nr:IS1 family transposase [Methylovulum sp.]MDD5125392.1 IS1 family transposase [Methylovulum sp.]